jgi:hypothetical protein
VCVASKDKIKIIKTKKPVRMKYRAQENIKKKIPVGVIISTPLYTGPGAHPASFTKWIASLFPGG